MNIINPDSKTLRTLKNELNEQIKDMKNMNICEKCIYKNTIYCKECMLVDSTKLCRYKEKC